MHRQLEGRTALVTGGGQGVGQGIARALAQAGADVVIAQRRIEEAEREAAYLRETFGVRAFAQGVDVTDAAAVDAMVALAVEQLGRLDILVNNAGGSFPKRLENHSDADMAGSLDLNYWSAFRAMRAAFPVMKAQKYGRVINIARSTASTPTCSPWPTTPARKRSARSPARPLSNGVLMASPAT